MLERIRSRTPIWLGVLTVVAVIAAACSGGDGGTGEPEDSALTTSSAGDSDGSGDDPSLAGMIPAPEFPGGHTWFNVSEPLSLSDLRGKVVLLDFWTSGCINCQQIIPDLMRLEDEFADELVVIGVHSGK